MPKKCKVQVTLHFFGFTSIAKYVILQTYVTEKGGDTVRNDMTLQRETIASLCAHEPVLVFDTLPSTNDRLKEMAKQGAQDGTVVIADAQTAGKGRLGRSFHSPKGKGLYLSYLWRPHCLQAERLLPLTGLCAVAALRAVEKTYGVKTKIKWTNDLLCNGRKIAGILTEMTLQAGSDLADAVIIGVGINVCQTEDDFPEDLRTIASSLALCGAPDVSRETLAAELILQIRAALFALQKDCTQEYLTLYRARCLTLGKRVRLLRGAEETFAVAEGIDRSFGLAVRYDSGNTEVIRSGEASVRYAYGHLE